MPLRTGVVVAALVACVAAWAASPGTHPAWRDVLDTPAAKSPLASRVLLNGLARAGQRLVAVGQRGHVITSDDAGKSWQQADVPVSSDLVAVSFPTATLGWAVGHDGVVLHSADAGKTWKRQLDGADNVLLDVWFADAANGYAVGAFGLALGTVDGGAHWEPMQDRIDNPKGLHLYAVRGVGADVYIVGEQGLALKLDRDSGRFRALELPYKGTLFGVIGNERAVLAHGLRGNVVRSTDGGRTWSAVATGVPVGLTASALADGRIVIVSQAGHVLVSRDDGASFTPIQLERPVPAAAVVAPSKDVLVLAGPRGVHSLP
jgi:photosystem II stability/assembly factor-like uncharacterized protein